MAVIKTSWLSPAVALRGGSCSEAFRMWGVIGGIDQRRIFLRASRGVVCEPVSVLPRSVPGPGRPGLLPLEQPVGSPEPPGRGRLPLAARRPACAASSRAWDSQAPSQAEPLLVLSRVLSASSDIWVDVTSAPPRRRTCLLLLVYFFVCLFVCFQHGSLQPRTSVRSVPGDAEREQAFQRLQLQNVCCQKDKRCLPRK